MKPQLVSKSMISYTKKKMNFISYNNNKNKSLINEFAIGLLIIVSIFLYFRYKNRYKIRQNKNKQLKNFIKEFQKVELELQEKKNNHLIRTFNKRRVFIDYAHTPDALESVLNTLRSWVRGKLWVVFGCGGNRDKTKRPVMGDIATSLSSKVIFTSDNPRNEDPDLIIKEMVNGVKSSNSSKSISISNRKEAIKAACQFAQSNDIILVAGKGHETYQEINGVKSEFDDFDIVKGILNQKN